LRVLMMTNMSSGNVSDSQYRSDLRSLGIRGDC